MKKAILIGALLLGSTGYAEANGFVQPASVQHQLSHPVLGITLSHPSEWKVIHDQFVSDAYGFTLVENANPAQPRMDSQSTERLALRVSLLRGITPGRMEDVVRATLDELRGLSIARSTIKLGNLEGAVLSGVPGMEETTFVFVATEDKVYKIVYGRGELDARGQALLHTLKFSKPTMAVEALGLPGEGESLRATPPSWVAATHLPRPDVSSLTLPPEDPQALQMTPSAIPGCVDFPTTKTIQVQWPSSAYGGTGRSWAGSSYYGEGGHVNCNTTNRLNDYYALDHALYEWDPVYAPWSGTVVYAGWAKDGWASSGRIVVVDLGNGYWHQSMHLRGINVSAGQSVTQNSIIGWVGGSGYLQDYYHGNHLHQSQYLNALLLSSSGGVYGGQSAQQRKTLYFHSGGGYYFGFSYHQEIYY